MEKGVLGGISSRLTSYYTSAQVQDVRQAKFFKVLPDDDDLIQNSVSYAGLVFTKENLVLRDPQDRFTGYEKRALLAFARDTLTNEFEAEKTREFLLFPIMSDGMRFAVGAFVTLAKDDQLRGCIGQVWTGSPLFETVSEMAKAAAFYDERFTPLTKAELADVGIGITILTPPYPVSSYNDIQLGVHGIILKKRLADGTVKRAVFLPQVPGMFDLDLARTLCALSIKAGLDKEAWRDGCEFEVFEGFEVKE